MRRGLLNPRLTLAGLAGLLALVLLLVAHSQSPPANALEQVEPPPGDCWGGALSAEALHCYVLEEVQRAGHIEVDGRLRPSDWSNVVTGWTLALPPFLDLAEPSAHSPGDGGDSVEVAYTLPKAPGFYYRLKLKWRAGGRTYERTANLEGTSTRHTFQNLSPDLEDGKWYQAHLSACRNVDRTGCGESVNSVPIYYVSKRRIDDNEIDEEIVSETVVTDRVRLDIGIDATEERAYVVKVETTTDGIDPSDISVATGSVRAPPPKFRELGAGQVVWVEHTGVNERRKLVLDVQSDSPTSYRVTISKPDFAFIEPLVWQETWMADLVFYTSMYNSSERNSSFDPADYRVELYCVGPDLSGAYHSTKFEPDTWLGSKQSRLIVAYTLCEGAAPKEGRTFNVFARLKIRRSCIADVVVCNATSSVHTISTGVTWPFVGTTLRDSHSSMMGGLQVMGNPLSSEEGSFPSCTLRFPLMLVPPSGSVRQVVSTTGHCLGADFQWRQGTYPMKASNPDVRMPGRTLLARHAPEPCEINMRIDPNNRLYETQRRDRCYSGGQAYALSPITGQLAGQPAIFRLEREYTSSSLIRGKLSFDHFEENSLSTHITIVAARRPTATDSEVHKEGRTTTCSTGS